MVKYREILGLTFMGISQRNAAFSVGCATSTTQYMLRRAGDWFGIASAQGDGVALR